jgi:hypothetical protein
MTMKPLRHAAAFLLSLFVVAAVAAQTFPTAQTEALTKNKSTNRLTNGPLKIPSGATVTVESGGTLVIESGGAITAQGGAVVSGFGGGGGGGGTEYSFSANDFNTSGDGPIAVALDYANAQKASGSLPGFLTANDWTVFSAKASAASVAAAQAAAEATAAADATAKANAAQAAAVQRANHTGSQAISTVTGLQDALDAKQPVTSVLTGTTASFTTEQEAKLAGIATGAQANAALASQADAEAGSDNTKTMTPLRVAQAIAALAGEGSGDLLSTNNLSDLASAATARTNLGLTNKTDHGNAGSALALPATTAVHTLTLNSASCALSVTSWPTTRTLLLIITQDATGGREIDWSAITSNAPEIDTDANAVTLVTLVSSDGGANVYALSSAITVGSGSGDLSAADIDTSAELRAIVADSSGAGSLIFAGGNIGAATATTPAPESNTNAVATTEWVVDALAALPPPTGATGSVFLLDDGSSSSTNGFRVDDGAL